MALAILHERAKDKNGNLLEIDGHDMTMIEAIYRSWLTSKNPRLQLAAIEYAFGKVAAPVEVSGKDGGAVQHEHKGQVHGGVDHVAAVLATLAAVGAIQPPGDGTGDAAEND
jgi:hypothetical protein